MTLACASVQAVVINLGRQLRRHNLAIPVTLRLQDNILHSSSPISRLTDNPSMRNSHNPTGSRSTRHLNIHNSTHLKDRRIWDISLNP